MRETLLNQEPINRNFKPYSAISDWALEDSSSYFYNRLYICIVFKLYQLDTAKIINASHACIYLFIGVTLL